jgi:hypothetical protein
MKIGNKTRMSETATSIQHGKKTNGKKRIGKEEKACYCHRRKLVAEKLKM